MNSQKKIALTCFALSVFLCAVGATRAAPLIILPLGEVSRLSYVGQERFIDFNSNGRPDVGDIFEGVVTINQIAGAATGTDFSAQLATKEITSHFSFTITDHSADFSHLEFGLLPGDSFDFHVGEGVTKNFDPTAADANARASDGPLWIGIEQGGFFVSVNDRFNGATLNRTWADLPANNSEYDLAREFIRTMLGKDAQHTYQGQPSGDLSTQAIFDNRVAGLSTIPGFTFSIFGEFDVFAAPEPATWWLVVAGLAIFFVPRKRSRILWRSA